MLAAATVIVLAHAGEAQAKKAAQVAENSESASAVPRNATLEGPNGITRTVADLITAHDYPKGALRRGEQGSTAITMTVSTTGRGENCTVVTSSGSEELDRATCWLVTRRARFRPAIDSSGSPVSGFYSAKFKWSLPTTAPQHPR